MDSSHRRFAISPGRSLGTCLCRSNGVVDSIRTQNNSFTAHSLLLPPEAKISTFRRPPGDACHNWEVAPRTKPSLPIQSPCIVASRSSEEWTK